MRSPDVQQLGMFSYVSVESRVPPDHPVRKLRILVDAILGELDELLAARYAAGGRPSIPPERILRASLLPVVYSVRSERLLMEQLNDNLLFRWFVGLNIDDSVWNHSTFSFNRQTASGCSTRRSPNTSSSTPCCWRGCATWSATSTSRWTARC